MKVACSPEAWPPRRPPAPSTTSKVCSPEEVWPLRRPPAPPAPNRRVWGAIGAVVLLQTATIAAVLAPRPETDARRRLPDEAVRRSYRASPRAPEEPSVALHASALAKLREAHVAALESR